MIACIIKSPHTYDDWILLKEQEESEKDESRRRSVEDIHWEAPVQLFPWGNVDPSGNPLLEEDCRGTAV